MTAKSNSFSRKFRNAFLTGLIIFLPLGTTIFVLNFLLGMFQEPATRLARELGLEAERFFFGLGETLLAILGLAIGVLALTALGFLSNYVLGKFFISTAEKFLGKVPFLNTVYRSAKQIVQTFGRENRAVFKEVVLIEYPRSGCDWDIWVSSVPLKITLPPVGLRRRTIHFPRVDFPQPDSPTRPRVSPLRMVRSTPSTAFTEPVCL